MMPLARLMTAFAAVTLAATAAAAQSPQKPSPFPDGARIAFVDVQYVFATSRDGKAAASAIQALESKKKADIDAKNKEVEALQQKLAQGAAVLNEETRGRLERDVARARIDFERLVQDAQSEVQDMQQQFQRAFSRKLFPAIGEVAKARDLWAVFSIGEANLLWHQPALDISGEIVARLDGAPAKQQ
jgi:Skp family chaperone for outer membrane proteins